MATRAQLEKYLQNPRVRQFLDLIAHTEGTEGNGYRTAFGGGRLSNLSDHPRYSKTFKQKNGKTNKTSAAGRYQFLRGTWDGLARQYGLKDFGPQSQDIAAVALLAQNGALDRILKGDMQGAVRKAGPTWASLPTAPASYSQPTKSWQTVNRFLGGKTSPSQKQQPTFQAPSFRPATELRVAKPTFAAPSWQSAETLKGAPLAPSFKPPEWQTGGDINPPSDVQPTGFKPPEWNSEPLEQEAKAPVFKPPEFMPPEQLQTAQQTAMPELEPQEWQT